MSHYLHDDPRMALAWGPWFSHEYIAYFAVQAIPDILSLPPVAVRPRPDFPDFSWPEGPRHVDLYKESYREGPVLDPFTSFDYGKRNAGYAPEPPREATIEPWKVVVLYSTEPDLHPDCDLQIHPLQKITGGSHGWRHMQFTDLGITIGMVPESFRHHRDMAVRSFRYGNAYWGWRYTSRATHYLADMGHPFHVRSAPTGFLIKNLLSFRKLFQAVSAIHTGYEVYSEKRFREGFPAFRDALLKGARQGSASGKDVDSELGAYVRRARKRLTPIFDLMLREFGQDLIDAYGGVVHDGDEDVSSQTRECSLKAARVLFRGKHRAALFQLDDATGVILEDVGRMLGMLLAGLLPAGDHPRS